MIIIRITPVRYHITCSSIVSTCIDLRITAIYIAISHSAAQAALHKCADHGSGHVQNVVARLTGPLQGEQSPGSSETAVRGKTRTAFEVDSHNPRVAVASLDKTSLHGLACGATP